MRAVADRSAAEVVALDGALKALADSGRGDLDLLALGELGDGYLVADRAGAVEIAELDQVLHRADLRLREMTELSLAQLALLGHPVGELDGCVPVRIGITDRGDAAGTGFDHGHGHGVAVLCEDLSHPDFLTEDRGHGEERSSLP